MTEEITQSIIWWKDKKLLIGIILIVLNISLGIYGKVLLITKFYEPFYLISGLSIYALSWIFLFLGIFLVGWETVKMIQYKIHHHVKKTMATTYRHAKTLPGKGYHYTKKGYHYTKELHRKGIARIKKSITK